MTRRDDTEDIFTLVDCDIHSGNVGGMDLEPYLPDHVRETKGTDTPGSSWTNPHGVNRRDIGTGDAETPLEILRAELFDKYDLDYGIFNRGPLSLGVEPNADHAAAIASAHNEELVDNWLDRDDRFLGSIIIAPQAPKKAVEEIERYAGHDRVVQVLMSSASGLGIPYGRKQFWPIYEAAADASLPVAVHPGTEGRGTARPPTGAGYPSRYLEWHTVLPANYIGHLTSLVTEGVFSEYPSLRFVCIEGGFAWVPHLMWRLDKNWQSLRIQVPWLEKPPSEYIKEQVRFTTQPFPEPENPEYIRQILEMINAKQTVMFSSDYPHWDNDDPMYGIPPLEESMERAIYTENAAELYDLPL